MLGYWDYVLRCTFTHFVTRSAKQNKMKKPRIKNMDKMYVLATEALVEERDSLLHQTGKFETMPTRFLAINNLAWKSVIWISAETTFICKNALLHMAYVFSMVAVSNADKRDNVLYILKPQMFHRITYQGRFRLLVELYQTFPHYVMENTVHLVRL